MPRPTLLDRLLTARQTMAEIVVMDARYLPIFERIEREIAQAEAQEGALDRARALVAQKASGSRSSR